MEHTVEYMTQCILLVGKREWKDCKASAIIGDILAAFNKATGQDVQLASIWEDSHMPHLHMEYPSIHEALEAIARYTGSAIRWHGTQVEFVEDEQASKRLRAFLGTL